MIARPPTFAWSGCIAKGQEAAAHPSRFPMSERSQQMPSCCFSSSTCAAHFEAGGVSLCTAAHPAGHSARGVGPPGLCQRLFQGPKPAQPQPPGVWLPGRWHTLWARKHSPKQLDQKGSSSSTHRGMPCWAAHSSVTSLVFLFCSLCIVFLFHRRVHTACLYPASQPMVGWL